MDASAAAANTLANQHVTNAKNMKAVTDGLNAKLKEYQTKLKDKQWNAGEVKTGLTERLNSFKIFEKAEYADKKAELLASIEEKTKVNPKGETDFTKMHKELKTEIKLAEVEAKKEVAVAKGKQHKLLEKFTKMRKSNDNCELDPKTHQ